MITEGEAAILLETTLRAFGNQSQSKQRSTLAYKVSYHYTGIDFILTNYIYFSDLVSR